MTSINATARTVEEAVANALQTLGADRSEVDIEVVQEPRPPLLGLGGREAKVRVTRRPGPAEECQGFVTKVLESMGYGTQVDVQHTGDTLSVTLKGSDLGGLIGRHGRTLDALEVLGALHLQRRLGRRFRVVVDAAGYRERREKALHELAAQAASRAVADGHAVALEPMEARDRRTVHLALAEDVRVTTSSEGEDEARHVVVTPQGGP